MQLKKREIPCLRPAPEVADLEFFGKIQENKSRKKHQSIKKEIILALTMRFATILQLAIAVLAQVNHSSCFWFADSSLFQAPDQAQPPTTTTTTTTAQTFTQIVPLADNQKQQQQQPSQVSFWRGASEVKGSQPTRIALVGGGGGAPNQARLSATD